MAPTIDSNLLPRLSDDVICDVVTDFNGTSADEEGPDYKRLILGLTDCWMTINQR